MGPALAQAADEVIPWASEWGIETAAHAHVLLLVARGTLDDMHALLAALRRRHKAVRQMPQVRGGSHVVLWTLASQV